MILLWVSLLVVFLDRITKMAVVSKMTEGDSIPVFENIFHITYVLNPGAAFGMLPHNRMFFLAIGVAAVIAIWWMRKDILAEGWRTRIGRRCFWEVPWEICGTGFRPDWSSTFLIFVSGRCLMLRISPYA